MLSSSNPSMPPSPSPGNPFRTNRFVLVTHDLCRNPETCTQGAERTAEAQRAIDDWASDTGRTMVIFTGIPMTGVWYGFWFCVLDTGEWITRRVVRKRSLATASPEGSQPPEICFPPRSPANDLWPEGCHENTPVSRMLRVRRFAALRARELRPVRNRSASPSDSARARCPSAPHGFVAQRRR